MAITTVGHAELKPQALKFAPHWKDALDPTHVNQLAIQIASGQSLPVTANAEGWVLKGRHSAAAYMKVQKGDPDLGIAAQPKIKVPVTKVSGSPEDERVLELSSIVNQRSAGAVELGPALKELVELLERRPDANGAPVRHEEAVAKVAAAAGVAPRTVAKKIREAKPEAERKPSTPRAKKIKVVDEKDNDLLAGEDDTTIVNVSKKTVEAVIPPDPSAGGLPFSSDPRAQAIAALEACLGNIKHLKMAMNAAMNRLHEIQGQDLEAACDQLQKDQGTLDSMEQDYRGYITEISGPA